MQRIRVFSRNFVLAVLAAQPLSVGAEELDEVIVTGEGIGSMRLNATQQTTSRLGLTSLQTPASVDLVTRDEIATKGDYDALAAATRVTGISASANPGNGDTSVSARGFNGPGSVMTTYDGTRLYVTAGTVTFPADTWTIERVEVLRGAGSVINGLGAIGATINYVPKRPRPGNPGVEGLAAFGGLNSRRLALGGGGDLSKDWSYRLDGAHLQADGWVDRNTKRRNALAGSVQFQPSQTFSMRFSLDSADIHEQSPYFGTPLISNGASEALRGQNYNFADGFLEYKDLWARVHTEWQPSDSVTLRNDTYLLQARRRWQNLEVYSYNTTTRLIDRDGYSYYGIVHDQKQAGTRLDALLQSSLHGLENRLTLGIDANKVDLDYSNNWSQNLFYAGNSVPVSGWRPDTLATANIPTVLAFVTDTKQFGVFFDDVLQLTPKLSAVFGARNDRIDFSRTNLALGGSAQTAFTTRYSAWGWRVGTVFQPGTDRSWYAQISRASDPITSPVTMSAGSKDLDPTRGRQFEVGYKQQLLEGKAEFTLAWFDIVKTGLVTRRPGSPFSEQVGKQSSRGLEGTLRVNPTARVSLDINAAWVKARFDEYYSGTISYAGRIPNSVPKMTANTWVNWTPRETWSVGAGWRYVATRFADDANARKLPAYALLDARIGWNVSDQVQLNLRGRNITDEQNFVLSEYDVNQWLFGEPRTWEFDIRYSL